MHANRQMADNSWLCILGAHCAQRYILDLQLMLKLYKYPEFFTEYSAIYA